jgi:hypothetical protein
MIKLFILNFQHIHYKILIYITLSLSILCIILNFIMQIIQVFHLIPLYLILIFTLSIFISYSKLIIQIIQQLYHILTIYEITMTIGINIINNDLINS